MSHIFNYCFLSFQNNKFIVLYIVILTSSKVRNNLYSIIYTSIYPLELNEIVL